MTRRRRQYAEFKEAQGKIVSLKSAKVRAADLIERSKKSRLELTAKREATGAAKPMTKPRWIAKLVLQRYRRLPTVMREFSLNNRTPDS